MNRLLSKVNYAVIALAIGGALAGCGRSHYFVDSGRGAAGPIPADRSLTSPRGLAMFAGHTGKELSWADVRDAMNWADVILVGEQHTDPVAHEVELALVTDAAGLAPPAGVSMEMLERDEQGVVDAYLAGEITRAEFVEQTDSANWAARGKWGDWYQPIVDVARDAKLPLIAANCPRQYVKIARAEGFGVLWAKPRAERKHYFMPGRVLTGPYADRFMRMMTHHASPPKPRKAEPATTQPAKRRMPHRKIDPNAFFRAQLMWDATMAGAIAQGLDEGLSRVIHIVGQFHTDFDGGTVQYLLDLKPDLKILTVSLQNEFARDLRPGDAERADVVIYTLAKPRKDNKPSD